MGTISVQDRFLSHLSFVDSVDTLNLAKSWKLDHEKLVGVVKSLQMNDELIEVEKKVNKIWELTTEGKEVVKHGSHEIQIYNQVPPEGILLSELMMCLPDKTVCTVGFNKAMAAGWLSVDKTQKQPLVMIKNTPKQDVVQEHLKDILNDNADQVPLPQKQDYKKRKLVQDSVITSYVICKGSKFCVELQKEANDLTAEMMSNGSWKDLQFKPYNFNALGALLPCGHLHPLLKVRAEVRKIFLEMGFKEMPTNNYVESSFWNFDALFQPQQHPARDAHDTFFISEPATCKNFPREYMERVKKVHSEGGFGSQGYGYHWTEEEASKNLLRTHTTAASARILYKMAQEGFRPAKYFSIDKVFRNETLDATHLAEFHQVEGVIADYDLSLNSLIGTLSTFFSKLGMDKLQFKPAYNPYTEPSMEIFGYHDGLGKMIEVGNSGLFRPEMLLPMGLPENVTVIAWGLSLERPTMIKYGVNNIRDLVGPKVDLKMVYDNPICRLDKGGTSLQDVVQTLERRWEIIISQLENLSSEVKSLKDQGDRIHTTYENQDKIVHENDALTSKQNSSKTEHGKNEVTTDQNSVQIERENDEVIVDRSSSHVGHGKDEVTANKISYEIENGKDEVTTKHNCLQVDHKNDELTTKQNIPNTEHGKNEVTTDQNSVQIEHEKDEVTVDQSSSHAEHGKDEVTTNKTSCPIEHGEDKVTTDENCFQAEHGSTEVVIFAKYSFPPFSLFYIIRQLSIVCSVLHVEHNHSSVDYMVSNKQVNFVCESDELKPCVDYVVRLIWKADTVNTLVVSPISHSDILGEVNILRYFCREYEMWPKSVPLYENRGVSECSLMDEWLDRIHFLLTNPTKKIITDLIRDLEKRLSHNKWLVGTSISIADIALWSAVEQCRELQNSIIVNEWFNDFTMMTILENSKH